MQIFLIMQANSWDRAQGLGLNAKYEKFKGLQGKYNKQLRKSNPVSGIIATLD